MPHKDAKGNLGGIGFSLCPLKNHYKMSYYERTLPHWQPDGRELFLTWRLSGTLPAMVMAVLRSSKTKEMGRRFLEFDAELDRAASGPLWLREPAVAALVVEEMKKVGDAELYDLHAWVVMPNHVHVLLKPRAPLAAITRAIKGLTARRANMLLGRTGKYFWQDETFDHWIRNDAEFERVKKYIEQNPVVAGLVSNQSDWPWCSAKVAPAA